MQLITIQNLTSRRLIIKGPVYDLAANETKSAIPISIAEVEVLASDLTSLAAAGSIAYNVYTDTTKDEDTQFATILDVETALPTVAHAARHENGGADEIDVTGLSGLLADSQTPAAHAVSHENGGADEISVLGLSGLLADGQTPAVHAPSHDSGGSDPVNRIALAFGCSGAAVTAQFVVPGFGASNATEIKVKVPVAMTVTEVRVWCGTAPGGALVDTFTLNINGVGSAAAVTVTGAAVTGTWTGTVAVAADDELSILSTINGVSADITVMVYGE